MKKRLTVHLTRVKKDRIDNKYVIKNTLSFLVKDDDEALKIVSDIENKKSKDAIKKWYISNIK